MNQTAVVYTVHKAASLLLFALLRTVSQKHDIPLYSPNARDTEFCLPDVRKNLSVQDNVFSRQPCLIGPIRRPYTFAGLAGHKTMVHLRDPRDIMTSMFFSWAYSHTGIEDAQRQHWIDGGIDAFVLEKQGDMAERFRLYCNWIARDDSIHVSTYEDLYEDYGSWLERFFAFLEIEDPKLIGQMLKNSNPQDIAALGEDPARHTRQGRPGDHRNKLAPETIRALNDTFSFYFDQRAPQ